jgi:hypothetical protein
MSRKLSIEKVLAQLQARIEHHRSRQAFHAEQEAFHQQEKDRHAAELKMVEERFESFQAAADAVTGLVAPLQQDQTEEKKIDDSIPPGKGAGALRRPAQAQGRRPHRRRQAPPDGREPADPPDPRGPGVPRGAVQADAGGVKAASVDCGRGPLGSVRPSARIVCVTLQILAVRFPA